MAASSPSSGLDQLLWIILMVGLVAVLCYIGWKLLMGMGRIAGDASEEERRFEEEQLQAALLSGPMLQKARPVVEATEAEVPATPPSPMPDPPSGLSIAGGPEKIATQLQNLGVVLELQGRIPLAVPPEGLIYRLKKGGSCAILPRMESPDAMEHFCRRFDLVFFPSPAGELLVLERFQSRLPSMINLSMIDR
ncbi:MAG TPA: hypothetical protein PK988_05195 [Candidatus Sumerlaeota bacterium]|nr:hypothetical protein [Candidatus Sumerlaeota bacterium]